MSNAKKSPEKKSGTATKKTSSEKKTGTSAAPDKDKNKSRSKETKVKSADRSSSAPPAKQKKESDPSSIANQILPFVFLVSSFLILLVLVLESEGFIVKFLKEFLLGLFSAAAFIIPALFVLLGVFWQSDIVAKRVTLKFWCAGISLVFSAMLMHIFFSGEASFSVSELYKLGYSYRSGGVIGGILCSLLLKAFGKIISVIIIISALFISVLLLFGLTPRSLEISLRYHIKKHREEKKERKDAAVSVSPSVSLPKPLPERSESPSVSVPTEDVPSPGVNTSTSARQHKFDPDIDISKDKRSGKKSDVAAGGNEEEDQNVIDQRIFDEVMRRTRERYGEQSFENAYATEEDEPVISYGTVTQSVDVETSTDNKTTESGTDRKRSALPSVAKADNDDGEIDLSKIFVDPDKIDLLKNAESDDKAPWEDSGTNIMEAERDIVSSPASPDSTSLAYEEITAEEVPAPEEESLPVYKFPPISLLADPEKPSAADLDELKSNAAKLVDILRSFNVKTRVSDVFRGPTITRYELTPEAGTKVRSVVNLADDIALGLAVTNVRIEAPIPGKPAVGIEVPNKKRDNVYLRTLLETEEFRNSKSRLFCALGTDVAGSPIFCDIAKMPHLLVAGATGMGKSVCINSIVMSLLFKSTPQEIRLIMIDPKKVELTNYNGIPHLHVPVVSDVKKAAGTLAWAVSEMEHRYELIESVGVRNIQGYNEITYNDPEKEYMPQMVIIIDEFADLMMTVKDDVETSVCRIAQMGRAAGIHLIIGTQRPSVNVVTGLIKANVPSRIAFTMSSQVDSRTVIDSVGAEKLLGKGDMLYAPVGVLKPQRVQGAFVSDAEVQRVIDFIRGICPEPQYDASAIEGIEEASARCSQKKGRGDGDTDPSAGASPDDPMLKQALELAVETGKISTSLIQRRLSLGYGRAAKLIDTMEARGYVSPPDGQRPREVLITRQQYQELVLHDDLI